MVFIVDDIAFGLLGAYVGKKVVDVVGDRLFSNAVLNPFERSQLERNTIERERMRQAAEQFKERMRFDREQLLLQFEDRKSQIEFQSWLQRWPLDNYPREIINDLASYGGRAVNLVICTQSVGFFRTRDDRMADGDKAKDFERYREQVDIVRDIHDLNGWLATHYNKLTSSHPVLPHIISTRKERQTHSTPDAMAITLREALHSEPTIFLDIDLRSPTKIFARVEMWGLQEPPRPSARDGIRPIGKDSRPRTPPNWSHPLALDLADVGLSGELDVQRDFAIKSLLAGLIDLAHLTYRTEGEHLVTPIAPRVLAESFDGQNLDGSSSILNYDHVIEKIYEQSSIDAINSCLDMVEVYASLGNETLLKHFFSKAALFLTGPSTDVPWHNTTRRTSRNPDESALLKRMEALRSAIHQNFPNMIEARPAPKVLPGGTTARQQTNEAPNHLKF